MIGTHYCEVCNGLIRFVDRKPYDEDGTIHWDTCKKRQFETVKKNGRFYETGTEEGYVYKGERWPTWIKGPRIVGEKYQPDTCNCGLPQWELCAADCKNAIGETALGTR